jgi:subtilisin family serine protease
MKRRTRFVRTLANRPGTTGLLLAVALGIGSLAILLAVYRSSGSPRATVTEQPATDDVPDAASPPGEVRPGTIGGGAGSAPRVRVVPDRLLVKFEEGTPSEVVTAVLARAGVTAATRIARTGTRLVEVPPAERAAALAALDASGAVEYAESDVIVSVLETVPNDAHWSTQWGPTKVSTPRAWDVARGSPTIVVAVLDTGVDFGHADLRGASVPGYDVVNDDSEPGDDHGHGTATAGVVAARTNNTEGIAGLCWTCSLMAVKVLGATGSGSTSTVARGIVWAVDHGARVINLSLGGPGSTQTLADAVDYAASRGVVVIAAAGNSGVSTPFYPAAYPSVVSVAATDASDQRYSWSNYGAWVQVAAPGCNVAPLRGGGYGSFCGTSSATPLVAGLAGLALSAKPGATRAQLEQAIRSAVVPIQAGVQYGRVDAVRMLSALGAEPPAPSPAPSPPPPAWQPPSAPPPADPQPPPTTTLPPAPRAPVVSTTARGRVSRRHPVVLRRTVAAGAIVATLTFRGASRLTVSIVDRRGRTVGRVTGASPLRAAVIGRAGTYRFIVSGHSLRAAPFTLRLSYAAPSR